MSLTPQQVQQIRDFQSGTGDGPNLSLADVVSFKSQASSEGLAAAANLLRRIRELEKESPKGYEAPARQSYWIPVLAQRAILTGTEAVSALPIYTPQALAAWEERRQRFMAYSPAELQQLQGEAEREGADMVQRTARLQLAEHARYRQATPFVAVLHEASLPVDVQPEQAALFRFAHLRRQMHEVAAVLPDAPTVFVAPDRVGGSFQHQFIALCLMEVRSDIKWLNLKEEVYLSLEINPQDGPGLFRPLEPQALDGLLASQRLHILTADMEGGKYISELAYLLEQHGAIIEGFIAGKADSQHTVSIGQLASLGVQLGLKLPETTDLDYLLRAFEWFRHRPSSVADDLDRKLALQAVPGFGAIPTQDSSSLASTIEVFKQITGEEPKLMSHPEDRKKKGN